jgi:tRNA1Val (adenine37-N6)-methyltransferase
MLKSRGQSGKFTFKQFEIIHQNSAMKVGTDGVRLGAWAHFNHSNRILDIGTGSGLIALMAAQKNDNVFIDAVEIDKDASLEAQLNVKNSNWCDRISIHQTSLQLFKPPYKFDSIISNPPFFQKGTKSPDQQRGIARQTDTLSYEDLIKHSNRLMVENGEISLIIPALEEGHLLKIVMDYGLFVSRRTVFIPNENKPIERILLSLKRTEQTVIETKLIHYNRDRTWTEDYKQLTKDFYLKI